MKNKLSNNQILRFVLSKNELGAVIPLVVLALVIAFVNPKFFNFGNIMDILRTACFTMMVAAGVTFLMTSGGLDLSVGATLSMAGVMAAYLSRIGMSLFICIVIPLIIGALVGLVNGFIVVKMEQPPFIATIATNYIVLGAVVLATNGETITGVTENFKKIGQYRIFGTIPIPIVYGLLFLIVGIIILSKTKFGRSIAAIGGNMETAYLAGIPVVERI